MWRKPVGEGAKRVTTESVIYRSGSGKEGNRRHAQGAVVYSRNRT
jgi:hypothetical protein